MNRFLLLLVFVFSSLTAQAVETVIKEVQLELDSRQIAHKQAIDELSRELVIEAIGESKYQEDEQRVEKQIIENQNRYILSTRSNPPVLQDDGTFTFTVTIQVSRENLKQVLLENNLFYASEASSCLLPIVSFSYHLEDKKQSYSWWLKKQNKQAKNSLKEDAGAFFDLLSTELTKYGFYPLNPVFQRMEEGTPRAVLPKNSRRIRNFTPLARFYSCDIILLGYVQVGQPSSGSSLSLTKLLFSSSKEGGSASPDWTQFSLNVFNIKTKRFLFKVKREFPFPPTARQNPRQELLARTKDVLDSLTYQLSAYQEKGSLDLNRLMISVQGPLNYGEKENLKKTLIRKVPGIQNLEEHLLTASRVVYIAEASQNISSIARQMKKASLLPFVIQVKSYRKGELEIYAKKQRQ